jgi:hypothetical protein
MRSSDWLWLLVIMSLIGYIFYIYATMPQPVAIGAMPRPQSAAVLNYFCQPTVTPAPTVDYSQPVYLPLGTPTMAVNGVYPPYWRP